MAKKPTSPKTKTPVVKRKPRVKKSLLKPKNYKWSWADFDDWNVAEQKDRWPNFFEKEAILTPAQKAIVKRNQALLLDKEAWKQKTEAFSSLFKKIEVENERNKKRGQFSIRFDQAVFVNDLECKKISFPCYAVFDGAKFEGDAWFNKATFEGAACFGGTAFKGSAVFIETTFEADANFNGTTFKEFAMFLDATFEGGAQFESSTFEGNAEFGGATFNSYTVFYWATFEGRADFGGATFEVDAGFYGATFEEEVEFEGARITTMSASDMVVKKNLTIKAIFKTANFSRLSVGGSTNLSGSEFETVPDFIDSKLDSPPEVAGMIVPPPEMVYKIKNDLGDKIRHGPFKLAKDKSDVAKYRKLKAMALAANDHEKDGEFFAYEMMAKRGHETTDFFPLLLNSLYWLLSFYGQSIARPLIWMFVSFLTFWAGGLGMIKYMTGSLQEFWFAGVHSTLNSMPLIGSLFRTTSTPKGHTSWYDETYHQLADKGLSVDWWAAISAFQQIIGAVLFFLLFLGLRNKFRLK